MRKLLLTLLVILPVLLTCSNVFSFQKAETLKDNFNDNSLDLTKWYPFDYGGTLSEENGQLWLTTEVGVANWVGMDSATPLDMTSSYISIEIISNGDTTLYTSVWFGFYEGGGIGDEGNLVFRIGDGIEVMCVSDVYNWDTLWYATFSPTTHRFLRIRESGGTVYMEYSSDKRTWVTAYSDTVANLFPALKPITSLEPILLIENGAQATSTTFKVDNYNYNKSPLVTITGD